MPLRSAGILLYRSTPGGVEVLLTHPGGPYWRNRDVGAWMIPKGHVEEGEDAATCAIREFEEELGSAPQGTPRPLCRIRQKGGKWVEAFALEGDIDAEAIVSNHYSSEWPPRSGRFRSYPEVDKAAWFTLERAREMMLESQLPILDALEAELSA
jgi:predicted NUDIX family NTP pyrophosphohydrolase